MILVGLTGGIGSGKSTVSAALAERGAVIIDADAIGRELQQPGQPLLRTLADRFGEQIITADGALDRPALAAIAFGDPDALKDLNAIVHPVIGAEVGRRIVEAAHTEQVVVMDIPLLTENPREGLQGIIVIDVPEEIQVHRLVTFRGFTEADARARIAQQASREARLATATFVIDNSGDLAALAPQIEALWQWVTALPQLAAGETGLRADGVGGGATS
ncbi:MAG: dephospho-CoA kinase [Actinomycetota bacterium]|nr:dephospho-CoA kinase [Actinomycetota bacterium]